MRIRNMLLTFALGLGLGACCVSVSHTQGRHPNLAAAIDLIDQASGRISAAQQANDWDMQGHAQHAQQLLAQARHEVQEAIRAANRH
jgi:hypothetical protein